MTGILLELLEKAGNTEVACDREEGTHRTNDLHSVSHICLSALIADRLSAGASPRIM